MNFRSVLLSLLLASVGLHEAARAADSAALQAAPELQQVSGNNQSVQAGVPFALVVRLVGVPTVEGVEVSVTRVISDGPTITCNTRTTDAAGLAALTCTAGFWPLSTQVRIQVGDEAGRVTPDFGVTVAPSVLRDGLTIITSDRITIGRNQDLQLGVQLARDGAPVEGARLTITRDPLGVPFSCPQSVVTDALGLAQFICRSLDVPLDATVLVTVRDSQGRSVTFSVLVRAIDLLRDGIFKLSGDDQAVTQFSTLLVPLVAQAVEGGLPQPGRRLFIHVSDPNLVTCPVSVVTGFDGVASIMCSAGSIQANGFVEVFFDDGADLYLEEPFRISVITGASSSAASFDLVSARIVRGQAGETRRNAIVVRTLAEDGSPAARAPVFFWTDRNIQIRPSVVISDFLGEARAELTFGCPAGRGVVHVGPQRGVSALQINVDVDAGGTALLTQVQGDGQSGSRGERLDRLALVARLTDRCFQPQTRQTVDWSVEPPGAATLEAIIPLTDGEGRSSVIVRLGQQAGPFRVIARHKDLSQTFNLAVAPLPVGLSRVSPERTSVPRGQTSGRLEVRLADEDGLPAPDRDVLFSVASGEGELTERIVRTDSEGRASTSLRAAQSFGQSVVLARLAGASGAPEPGGLETQFQVVVGGRFPESEASLARDGGSFAEGWVPGGLGVLFGRALSEDLSGVAGASSSPFPYTLRGVSVTVNGRPAPILAVANVGGQEQINLQVPFETEAPGTATVAVSNNGSETVIEGVQVFAVRPGVFERRIEGRPYAAALHPDFRLVAPGDPVKRGDAFLLFLTGLGPTSPPVPTNRQGPVPPAAPISDPVVLIDGASADVLGSFYAPGLTTVYQINTRVRESVEPGDRELTVTAGGAGSQTVLLPVE